MPDLAGTVVSDRYELAEILGQGGQGTVYRARDRTTGRGVAVKMLSPGVANNPEFAIRLAREQEALVALAGTSAVAVYDLCRAPGGSLCLVMELLEGTDLERHLAEIEQRRERLPKERINAIFDPIVDTLERAHEAGIVHRDVKPSNIFVLSNGGGVRLLDFGLSRMQTAAPLTAAGMVVGSPAYIAPEIWKGQSEDVDGRADVYSLGVILFRCLTGNVPFESESLVDTMRLVTMAPRPSLHEARPDLPKSVDAWVEKALAVDRAERFDGVRALWKGLLQALDYTPPPRLPRPVAEGLVGAWRAATSVFRRFIEAASAGMPGAASTAGASAPEPDDDGDRPTLIFKRPPPPSIVPETSHIDDAWEEVADSEIHSSPPSARKSALRPPPLPSTHDDAWEEVHEIEPPSIQKPEKAAAATGGRAKGPSAREKAPNARKGPGKSKPKNEARPTVTKRAPTKKASAKTAPKKKKSSTKKTGKPAGRKKSTPPRRGSRN
jgi:eukaryotic-like serine/threonine-protein kinase